MARERPPYRMSVPDNLLEPMEIPPWPPLGGHTTPNTETRLIDNLTRGLYDEVHRGLPEGKLPGPDEVPNDILKRMSREFHDLLFEIMRRAWVEQRTPVQWKRSVVALYTKKAMLNS